MQVPTAVKLTAPPETEHTDELEESTVTVTGRPEVEVALGVYVGPPTVALVGADVVNVMVWAGTCTAPVSQAWPGVLATPRWSVVGQSVTEVPLSITVVLYGITLMPVPLLTSSVPPFRQVVSLSSTAL